MIITITKHNKVYENCEHRKRRLQSLQIVVHVILG